MLANGSHREFIGGLWDELGALQYSYLVKDGLKAEHRLIDIGCGCFRLGVRIIPYLNPGNYFGIDISVPLLDVGYEKEIEPAGLSARFPRQNAIANSRYDISAFGGQFDYGIAQSVFTHLPLGELRMCLMTLAPQFKKGARLHVTYFPVPEEHASGPFHHHGGVTTHPDRDPFHHTTAAVRAMSSQCPGWDLTVVGRWNHPRAQEMLLFTRL